MPTKKKEKRRLTIFLEPRVYEKLRGYVFLKNSNFSAICNNILRDFFKDKEFKIDIIKKSDGIEKKIKKS